MSLQKAKRSEIPTDAIIIDEEEALGLQIKLIKDWKTKGDTWVFKHGFTILSAMSAISAIYINSHYRTKLRLHSYGRAATYIPIVILPSMLSAFVHQQLVTHDVLLQKSCPVCIQVRSASIQAIISTVVPTIMAPLSGIPLAIRYFTYNVPPLTTEPRKVLEMLMKHTKPIGNILTGIMLFNAFIGGLIGYQETKSFITVHKKIDKLEKESESNFDQLNFE